MEQHHIQRDLHKKRIFQKRQLFPGFPVGEDEEPPTRSPVVPPTTTSSTTPIIRGPTSTPGPIPTPSTTSTSATTSSSTINPLSISIPGFTTSSSTTSSRALTTSTSTSLTTSSTTSSSSSASTTPLATQSRNVATTTQGSTITRITTETPTGSGSRTVSSAAASSTATPESTSNTGAIVGGIFGAIVGIAILACIIAFVIRKLRQRRLDEEHFDAAQFRNSAMVIEDDDAPIVHNDAVAAGYNNGGRGFGARPPTMIERHMANTPALPVAAYGAYGASAQVNQYPDYGYEPQQQYHGMPTHDMNNIGNPFAPSDPMMDQRSGHDMYGQQPVYGYENPAQYHAQQQQYVDMERVTSPGRVHSPPHPTEFSAAPEAAAHPTTLTPGQNIPPQSQVQGSPVQTPPAQTTPQSQQQRESAPAAGVKRPETIYDEDDAYGGM